MAKVSLFITSVKPMRMFTGKKLLYENNKSAECYQPHFEYQLTSCWWCCCCCSFSRWLRNSNNKLMQKLSTAWHIVQLTKLKTETVTFNHYHSSLKFYFSPCFFRSKSCWMFFAADLHVFHMRLDYVEGLTHQQINRKTDCIPFELQLCCDCYWAVSSPFLCAPSCSIGKKAQNFAIVLKLINCNTDATDQIKIYIICHISSEWMHCAFFLASSFSPKISTSDI